MVFKDKYWFETTVVLPSRGHFSQFFIIETWPGYKPGNKGWLYHYTHYTGGEESLKICNGVSSYMWLVSQFMLGVFTPPYALSSASSTCCNDNMGLVSSAVNLGLFSAMSDIATWWPADAAEANCTRGTGVWVRDQLGIAGGWSLRWTCRTEVWFLKEELSFPSGLMVEGTRARVWVPVCFWCKGAWTACWEFMYN